MPIIERLLEIGGVEALEVGAMPRSIQDIPDHGDELKRRFEEYEPDEADERPVEEYILERAALERARSERRIVEAVAGAPSAGIPWNVIGRILGTSAQAVQQRSGGAIAGRWSD